MAEVLSQNEIDALLSAVSSGDVQSEEKPIEGKQANFDWVAYDLASQEKFLKGRLVALEGIHERFCRLFRANLHNLLNTSSSVTYKSTEILRFSEYLSGVVLPTSLNVISMRNPAGYMILVVGSKLMYALVDAYYGGSERPFSQVGHRDDFTKIEKNLIEKVTKIAIKELQEAWKLNYPVELSYLTSEPNPIFVSYIHGSESVAVVNFEVEFENVSGPLALIVQLRALDPIRKHLSVSVTKEITADKKTWKEHWEREISAIPVSVVAKLGETKQTLRQTMKWEVGDTLMLGQDAVDPLTVEVEGIPKFLGQMGVKHGSAAIKVTDVLETPQKEKQMAEPKENNEVTENEAPQTEAPASPDLKVVGGEEERIGQILDIPLKVSVELGRSRMLVQDLLELHKGSVLELNKLAGEPLEVLVNEKVVARGEVVVVNEKFGVRLTDIVSHTERIRQLGEST